MEYIPEHLAETTPGAAVNDTAFENFEINSSDSADNFVFDLHQLDSHSDH